jgi:hypothetical protein
VTVKPHTNRTKHTSAPTHKSQAPKNVMRRHEANLLDSLGTINRSLGNMDASYDRYMAAGGAASLMTHRPPRTPAS